MDESVIGFAEELGAGERRRAFVVDELIDAGLRGRELVHTTVRLTGLDEGHVTQLLRERGPHPR